MTQYDQLAAENLRSNVSAMGYELPRPTVDAWLPARDGALTARIDGQWLAGCSVPKRSSEMMLRKYQFKGSVGCLLCPTHASQVREVFHHMDETQALIVILPDQNQLPYFLSCDNFAAEFNASRLHFCTGEQWSDQLLQIYRKHPGMSVPVQFIKLPILDTVAIEPIIKQAQKNFSELLTLTNQRTLTARNNWSAGESLCIVAGSRYRMWSDAGWNLSQILASQAVVRVNPDLPLESAASLVAERAQNALAIITCDTGRADSPDLIHPNMPWICWVTRPRMPAYVPAAKRDGLIVSDPTWTKAAIAAGWPAERIRVGGYPALSPSGAGSTISIFYDLPSLTAPKETEEYSSQRLIWEAVTYEMQQNPFIAGFDPMAYLQNVLKRNRITDTQFPIAMFIERIVLPAHILGVAQLLISKKLPVALYGSGWNQHNSTAPFAKGPLLSREAFVSAIDSSKIVIDHTLSNAIHPIRSTGRPIVASAQLNADAFLRAIAAPVAPQPIAPLTASIVRELLG